MKLCKIEPHETEISKVKEVENEKIRKITTQNNNLAILSWDGYRTRWRGKKLKEGRKNVEESFAGRYKRVMSTKPTFSRHILLALQFNSQAASRKFTKHRFNDHDVDGRLSLLHRFLLLPFTTCALCEGDCRMRFEMK